MGALFTRVYEIEMWLGSTRLAALISASQFVARQQQLEAQQWSGS